MEINSTTAAMIILIWMKDRKIKQLVKQSLRSVTEGMKLWGSTDHLSSVVPETISLCSLHDIKTPYFIFYWCLDSCTILYRNSICKSSFLRY